MSDVSKQRKVLILNPASADGDRTSPARALTLVAQGRAVPVDAWTIRMLEASEQHQAAVLSASGEARSSSRRHSPSLAIVNQRSDPFMGQTFIPYPQPGSFKRAA